MEIGSPLYSFSIFSSRSAARLSATEGVPSLPWWKFVFRTLDVPPNESDFHDGICQVARANMLKR